MAAVIWDLHRLNRFERPNSSVIVTPLIWDAPIYPLFCGGAGRSSAVESEAFHPRPLTIYKLTVEMASQEQDSVSEDGHLHAAVDLSPEANDMIKAVDEMLETMTTKFHKISSEVFAKMDEMAQRIDDLEAAIKAGSDQTTSDGVGS